MKKTYQGVDGTVGFIFLWSSETKKSVQASKKL
jgi:hypothetical protein